MEDNQKIGNKYDVECELECILCGIGKGLSLIAHRNSNGYICGFVAFCKNCFESHPSGAELKVVTND